MEAIGKQAVLRILNVEDEAHILTIIKIALEADGFVVETCMTGRAALEKIHDFQPDVILLDVLLPDMTGMEILGHIRKNADTAQTPVIFLTAQVQPHEERHLMSLGASGIIRKPFDPMTLSSEIRKICGTTNG